MKAKENIIDVMVKNHSRSLCGSQCPSCGKKIKSERERCQCGQKISFSKMV